MYNKKYYEDRDYLDSRLAESIKIVMHENNLKTVLDVGCGTGKLVKFFNNNGLDAYGCDFYEQAVIAAKKINKKNTIIKASATKLPFKNGAFDLVTAISVIEHLTQKKSQQFLKEAHRVLKPHGYIFIVTPNFASPWRFIQGIKWFGYSDPTHINFFTPLSFWKLTKKYGFHHPKFWFKTSAREGLFRNFFNYLLFSTPFCFIRNSFWIAAQKRNM